MLSVFFCAMWQQLCAQSDLRTAQVTALRALCHQTVPSTDDRTYCFRYYFCYCTIFYFLFYFLFSIFLLQYRSIIEFVMSGQQTRKYERWTEEKAKLAEEMY